jgi:hypothetical protein
MTATNGVHANKVFTPPSDALLKNPPTKTLTTAQGTFLFTSESVGEGHPDKIW